ncbi:MAG: HAMP domain-containing histidine kinase [Candidatus Omnitrophica bacterium]|nr:HAMP domain-containing histidine kinase [Candidatus Omnitrophota bacterium]
MQDSQKDKQKDKNLSKLVLQELEKNPYREFNIAFALMSVIPFLAFLYILSTKFSQSVLMGHTGAVFFIAIIISLTGFLAGYQIVKNIINKVIEYAARVKRADSMKSDFVAAVSHDLKSPLGIIKLSISNLLDGVTGQINEKQKNTLKMCRDIVERTTNLVHDLLDVYKFEIGMVELDKKSCNFVEILEKQLKECETTCQSKQITLKKKVSSNSLMADLDENRISQVINNLLSNAVKFTPQRGSIAINSYLSDGLIRLEVIDSGPGIASDKKEKIFDKFVRLDGTKEGTGLGLAITKDIIELHHGHIWVESSPGKGSRFVVVLPQK